MISKIERIDDSFVDKINELVDAINELQEFADVADKNLAKLMEEATRPENVQDKFAEQRKWIGKLCKFWDIDNDYLYYGPLTKISDTGPYYYECNHRICYVHCEPVKDDVIYKGGDNE